MLEEKIDYYSYANILDRKKESAIFNDANLSIRIKHLIFIL